MLKRIEETAEIFPAPLYWEDVNHVVLGGNRALFQATGGEKQLFIGKTPYDFYPKAMADHIVEHNKKVMLTGKTLSQEEAILDIKTGEYKYFTAVKAPFYDEDGKVIGIVGTSVDITEQKKIEEELRQAKIEIESKAQAMATSEAKAAAAKTKAIAEEEMRKTVMVLVGDIVHDLRTPIATIRTVQNILTNTLPSIFEILSEAETLGSKKVKLLNQKKLQALVDNTLLEAVKSSVTMMDNFINTTLAELNSAQKYHETGLAFQQEDLTRCSSRRIIENTLEAYSFPNKITVHQHIAYDFFLMGNSILIMKILFNLLQNAIDQITLNGSGDITISTEDAGDWNILKVKDTGGGASPEIIEHLFEGYFTTKKNGTGIGLAFSKKTMNNFGGDLICHSVFGEFIEFSLLFPKIVP